MKFSQFLIKSIKNISMERKIPVQIDLVAPIPTDLIPPKDSDGLSWPLEPSLSFLSLQIKHSGHFVRRKSNHKEISADRHFLGGEIFIDRVLRRTERKPLNEMPTRVTSK